ncbi:DNA primase [Longibacter salinarum]|uniref:DNA primase n=1 Tax=Longibacter salinarum TaxID=1850348 RepID=A0A2A8CWA8_9BACT|nr:DNA primase [Longibacter salinarum]PEN12903.1 DNA primase [Longibacter salinarum]
MAIPDHKLEEVRDVADVVDVINDYVNLKRSGSRFKGLCPFHDENTPSFSVDPEKNLYYCFGCQRGGDVFKFVQEIEGVGFLESVRMLAERFGVPLPDDEINPEAASEKEAIFHALRWAARWFYNQLTDTNGGYEAMEYLHDRGFQDRTIARFGLGWAPDRWDGLLKAAKEEQIDEEILQRAGLIIERNDGSGYYDRYRGRVIFPILSHVGKVLGFGGRILDADADQPKYINSPETEVYDKSRVLYGLRQAKQAIRSEEEVLLVEGYTDVISLYQAGVENVVASSGTSLTDGQVQTLDRYAKRIVLLYDADEAGSRAAVRAMNLVLQNGLGAYAVELPNGEDPDSFVRAEDAQTFAAYIEEHRQDLPEFAYRRARREGRFDTPEDRVEVQREIVNAVAQIPDRNLRREYVRRTSDVLNVPDSDLFRMLEEEVEKVKRQDQRRARRKQRRQQRDNSSGGASVNEPQGRPVAPPDARDGSSGSTANASSSNDAPPPHTDADYQGDESDGNEDAGEGAQEARSASQRRPPLPEEKVLLRLMLDSGTPMVEFILGNMSLGEFTEGPARDMVEVFIDMYSDDAVKPTRITDGEFGAELQSLAASVMVDKYTPSENWRQRQNISVPRFNQEPYEAGASAMTLLKLDRVDEAITRTKEKMFEASRSATGNVGELQKEMMQLYDLRKQIRRREFLDWE